LGFLVASRPWKQEAQTNTRLPGTASKARKPVEARPAWESPKHGKPSFGELPQKFTFVVVDVSYAAPQAHRIVNIVLHQEYPPSIIFIFSQGMKDLYDL
jgi:hypothetical protein